MCVVLHCLISPLYYTTPRICRSNKQHHLLAPYIRSRQYGVPLQLPHKTILSGNNPAKGPGCWPHGVAVSSAGHNIASRSFFLYLCSNSFPKNRKSICKVYLNAGSCPTLALSPIPCAGSNVLLSLVLNGS